MRTSNVVVLLDRLGNDYANIYSVVMIQIIYFLLWGTFKICACGHGIARVRQ